MRWAYSYTHPTSRPCKNFSILQTFHNLFYNSLQLFAHIQRNITNYSFAHALNLVAYQEMVIGCDNGNSRVVSVENYYQTFKPSAVENYRRQSTELISHGRQENHPNYQYSNRVLFRGCYSCRIDTNPKHTTDIVHSPHYIRQYSSVKLHEARTLVLL